MDSQPRLSVYGAGLCASTLLLGLAACGGGGSSSSPPGFTLAAATLTPGTVTAGDAATSKVTVTPENGYAGTVTLWCKVTNGGIPAPTCTFSPSPVSVGGAAAGISTLTLSTSGSTPGGSYSVSVTATDASGLTSLNGPQMLPLIMRAVIQHVVILFQENRTPDNTSTR